MKVFNVERDHDAIRRAALRLLPGYTLGHRFVVILPLDWSPPPYPHDREGKCRVCGKSAFRPTFKVDESVTRFQPFEVCVPCVPQELSALIHRQTWQLASELLQRGLL